MPSTRFGHAFAMNRASHFLDWKEAHLRDAIASSSFRPSTARPTEVGSIVVPLDGTRFAEHAIPLAVSVAKRSGALLKLVHVFVHTNEPIRRRQWDAYNFVEERLRTEARRYLDRVERRILAKTPEVDVITYLADAGRVTDGIDRASKTADLVVMATRRRGWVGRFFFGSISHELLRTRTRPMIFVRGDDAPVDFSADPIPRHLTIALDGSAASEHVLDTAGTLARLSGAKSTLIHVDNPHDPKEQFPHSSASGYLNWSRNEFAKLTPDVETYLVRSASSPSRGILNFVQGAGPGLLAVTTRVSHPSFRSTTERLIRKSPVPVLVVPAEEAE